MIPLPLPMLRDDAIKRGLATVLLDVLMGARFTTDDLAWIAPLLPADVVDAARRAAERAVDARAGQVFGTYPTRSGPPSDVTVSVPVPSRDDTPAFSASRASTNDHAARHSASSSGSPRAHARDASSHTRSVSTADRTTSPMSCAPSSSGDPAWQRLPGDDASRGGARVAREEENR